MICPIRSIHLRKHLRYIYKPHKNCIGKQKVNQSTCCLFSFFLSFLLTDLLFVFASVPVPGSYPGGPTCDSSSFLHCNNFWVKIIQGFFLTGKSLRFDGTLIDCYRTNINTQKRKKIEKWSKYEIRIQHEVRKVIKNDTSNFYSTFSCFRNPTTSFMPLLHQHTSIIDKQTNEMKQTMN